jgi:hypothetical protein
VDVGATGAGYHCGGLPRSDECTRDPIELSSFQIASIPEQDMLEIFAPDRPNETFDKRVRKSSQLHPM